MAKRQKTVFTNSSIWHEWAHMTQDYGRASNCSFQGRMAYSYRARIANIVDNAEGQHGYLVSEDTYSHTTAQHISELQSSIPGRYSGEDNAIFTVPFLQGDGAGHISNMAWFASQVQESWDMATTGRCKRTRLRHLNSAKQKFATSKRYAKFYALEEPRFPVDIEELDRWTALCQEWHDKPQNASNPEKLQRARETREEMKRIEKILPWSEWSRIRNWLPAEKREAFAQWMTPVRVQWQEFLASIRDMSYQDKLELEAALKEAGVGTYFYEILRADEAVIQRALDLVNSSWNTDEAREARKIARETREAEREAERIRAQAAREARIAQERIDRAQTLPIRINTWREGGRMMFERSEVPTALLRVEHNDVATSWGASFPLEHARLAIRMLNQIMADKRCTVVEIDGIPCKHEHGPCVIWQTNGHSIPLGHYRIDRILCDGTIYAGCHVVQWPEVQRLELELANVEVSDNVSL